MLVASSVGRLLVWLVIAFLGVALRRVPGKAVCQMCLAMLLAWVMTDAVIKPIVREPRPFTRAGHARVLGPRPTNYSFPSAHASAAFSAATALSRAWPGATLPCLLLAVLTSYTRVYLGVHYPIDVAGGALVGVACALFAVGRSRWRPPAATS